MPRISLPPPDAPMQLADGSLIGPSIVSTFRHVEVPSNTQAQRLVTNTRRKLADLPAMPKQLNSYSAVLVYTASGLTDAEISIATGFTVPQIQNLRTHEAYKQLEQYIIAAAREEAESQVVRVLADAEVKAAESIVELATVSEDESVRLSASKDILNRRGHMPKQQVDVQTTMQQTFRIEVVDKRGSVPVLDMEADNGIRD